jgi:isopenicillin N synthase-like dioxygenase
MVRRDLKAEQCESSVIPIVDIGPLFAEDKSAQQLADRALFAAARDSGFLCVTGVPAAMPLGSATRERLLAIFALEEAEKRRLYRRKFAPENRNVYRGWFPIQPGNLTSKEGIDLGSDVVHPPEAGAGTDPLLESTPLPDERRLPGWRAAISAYYTSMERIAAVLMRSLARSLALPSDYFDSAFRRGLSTLRLIRYPPRAAAELASMSDPDLWVASGSERRHLAGAPHTDSGFLTLLAQDGVAGLQARCADGSWIDVPPAEGTLVVNFGQVLEQWSAQRIRATEHRVLGSTVERYSIPFFYEARADATIAPLPLDPADAFSPFQYGDFLWKRMLSFVEFRGMQTLRNGR